jgi:capsid protein
MIAGSSDPLFDDWAATVREPNRLVAANVKVVAARASSLVEDWPVAAAMVRARLRGTHGPKGLTFTSLFQADASLSTTDDELATRRQIMAALRRRDRRTDAGGQKTRRKWDRAIDWMAIVLGNGWGVRVQQSDGHRWRLVHPFRVRNPKGKSNDERWQDGVELDAEGRPAAVWIDTTRQGDLALPAADPIRVPWYAKDDTANVVHRKGWDIPGAIHGLSFFAPLMMPARQLQGVAEAYVAAKRVQASIPLLFEVEDIAAAKQAYAGTRLANLLVPKGSSVTFPSWKFEGADYQAFTDTEIRNICAAWGIPWELVLGDHSAKSGASSRSLWQEYYQQSEEWALDFTDEVARPRDEAQVREAALLGEITGLTDDWERNMAGAYQGPPVTMPDPVKEADAAEKWDRLGKSRTATFREQGWDYREETLAKEQEQSEPAPAPTPAPVPDKPTPEGEDDSDDEEMRAEMTARAQAIREAKAMAADLGVDWRDLLPPAFGATPAPAAPAEPPPAQLAAVSTAAQLSRVQPDMNDLQFRELVTRLDRLDRGPQLVVQNGYQVKTEDVKDLATALAAAMPQTVVHIEPAVVKVDAHLAAPQITIQPAELPAPVFQVPPAPVAAIQVTNTIATPPQRPVKVTTAANGDVLLTPVEG